MKGLEDIPGLMAGLMKVCGKIITCMAKVSIHGKMDVSTKVNTSTIRRAGMACTRGLMDVSTKETGTTASNMEKEGTSCPMEQSEWVYGSTGKGSSGLMKWMVRTSIDGG